MNVQGFYNINDESGIRKVLCNITKVIIIIKKQVYKKAENNVDKTSQYGNTLTEGANYLERKIVQK